MPRINPATGRTKMYTDGEGGNIGWTAPDGSYNELDSYNNAVSRIYNYYQGNYHSLQWPRDRNVNLGLLSGIVKSVRYSQAGSTANKGSKTFTHTAPSGYTLLVAAPIGAYTSGDAASYITDRNASQSGTTVSVTMYIHNPNTKAVAVVYNLLYVRSEFA